MNRLRPALLAALCCITMTFAASAQETDDTGNETPSPAPPQVGLIVNDLVVMQADLYGNAINDPGDFETTLFNGSPRRREVNTQTPFAPMPLGLITLTGEITQPTNLRIDIADAEGRFLGHWPKGVAGSRFLEWHNIQQVETPAGRLAIHPEHWLAPIRDTQDTLSFNSRKQIDRFFNYDATFPFQPPLKVEGSRDEGYTLTGTPPPGTQHILVVRRDNDAWQVGHMSAQSLLGPITMRPADSAQAGLEPLINYLREQGYPDAQIDTAVAILEDTAFGDASMSLVYLVDHETLDDILPLTVTPAPLCINRAGIIVINNVEPDIANTVGGLIEQLASDQWATRDAAQRALIEMDRAAIALIRTHTGHPDAEVAFRIEQIIAAFDLRHE